MKVLHISAECYPAAKTGGLADVVGALPKYLCEIGVKSGAVIPKYDMPWIREQSFTTIFQGHVRLHNRQIGFSIEQLKGNLLGFPFFVVNIPGIFDREGVYSDPNGNYFRDEVERYLSFQQAILEWIKHSPGKPEILHCHDHHSGLIPFMLKHCPAYKDLAQTPTVFTIHNGAYHGAYSWSKLYLLPYFEEAARGLLDWRNAINPLASGIKCTWRLTTVSPGYLDELLDKSAGLEDLMQHEKHKAQGILNGIDAAVWNPATDPYIAHLLKGKQLANFKQKNKAALSQSFQLDFNLPVITFIGRLVREKGADLLPDLITKVLHSGMPVSFAVLGTGDKALHRSFEEMKRAFPGRFDAVLAYDEGLAHQLYAGSDFLIMPSRVEPCGLNQMYAMHYGTVPIVRAVGGLKNTVPDIGEPNGEGRGIQFTHFSVDDAFKAVYRASELYKDQVYFKQLSQRIHAVDFSWERAAGEYVAIYESLVF